VIMGLNGKVDCVDNTIYDIKYVSITEKHWPLSKIAMQNFPTTSAMAAYENEAI